MGQISLFKCNTGADHLCELRSCCCKAHLSDAHCCITRWSQRVSEPAASLRGHSLATSSTEAAGPSGWASQQTTPISCSLKLRSNGSHVWERQTSWAVASKVILAQKYVPSYAKISTCWTRSMTTGLAREHCTKEFFQFSLYHQTTTYSAQMHLRMCARYSLGFSYVNIGQNKSQLQESGIRIKFLHAS